jgi:hypothetical protein
MYTVVSLARIAITPRPRFSTTYCAWAMARRRRHAMIVAFMD